MAVKVQNKKAQMAKTFIGDICCKVNQKLIIVNNQLINCITKLYLDKSSKAKKTKTKCKTAYTLIQAATFGSYFALS